MTNLIARSTITVVVGLGQTGFSVARFLAEQGQRFFMVDSRENPPNLEVFQKEFPDVVCDTGPLDEETLCSASEVVVSPGVPLTEPALVAAREAGVSIVSDIELFAREAKAPIVAISGSNAKSTVTVLVAEIAKNAGINVAVGGNLGTPALQLLNEKVELYILEVSSFQLESTHALNAKVAVILNMSEDHMDRYGSMLKYHAAKQRIFYGVENVVINRDDALTQPLLASNITVYSFGRERPDTHGVGIVWEEGKEWIAYEFTPLLEVADVRMHGRHNLMNAMAATAICIAADVSKDAIVQTLKVFNGLPHRCEWVARKKDIDFYNDSKATNVGATIAALQGLARLPAKLVLIAGGESKGADFSSLNKALRNIVRAVILIGNDADVIESAIEGATDIIRANTLEDAVQAASEVAQMGDAVLLSPACASFDMFENYEDRGRQFAGHVMRLPE